MPYADPAKRREYARRRYQDDPEFRARHNAKLAARRAADPDKAREDGRRETAAYRARHPERIAEYKARPESKAREAAWMAASRAANPEHHRAARLRQYRADPLASTKSRARAHGITVADYEAMFAAQGGACAICGQVETTRGSSGRPRRLAIDHDHATGDVRGLLCHRCNVALGLLDDSPDILEAATAYLRVSARRTLRVVET